MVLKLLITFTLGMLIGVIVRELFETIERRRRESRCHHRFVETNASEISPISGKRILFICSECGTEEWIYYEDAEHLFEKQRIKDLAGIKTKVRYLKEKDLKTKGG